jgi:5'-nucleotidase
MQYGGCHPEDGCQDGDGYRGADFQWLAANVAHATEDNKPNYHDTLLPPTAIRTFRGVKIGFIGMTLEGTPSIVSRRASSASTS